MRNTKIGIFIVMCILLGTSITENIMANEEWYNYSSLVSSTSRGYGRAEIVSGNTDNSKTLVINFYDTVFITIFTQYLDNTWDVAVKARNGLVIIGKMPISNVVYNKGKKLSFTLQGIDFTLLLKKEAE
jgi:hypothetical protein